MLYTSAYGCLFFLFKSPHSPFFFFSFSHLNISSEAGAKAAASDGRGTAPSCDRGLHCPVDEACWLTGRQCQMTWPGMGTESPSLSAWPEGRRAGRWASECVCVCKTKQLDCAQFIGGQFKSERGRRII